MAEEKNLLMRDYEYDLPDHRIAQFPLAHRDQSKLLVYKDGKIFHNQFNQLVHHLPASSTLFFNNTKVIPARLRFKKETGAIIEVFLLHPITPSAILQQAMEATGTATWQCTIGNLKRWPDAQTLTSNHPDFTLTARLVNRTKGIVEFSWTPEVKSFAEIISKSGDIPLPPYLNRATEPFDQQAYQTVYSKHKGAVAAPTAGLHFTDSVLQQLKQAGHHTEYLTLHVSAGTFQPVKADHAQEHVMHQEQIVITRDNIVALLNSRFTVAVGTTSVRTLESMYWFGVKLMGNQESLFQISQQDAYTLPQHITVPQALQHVLNYIDAKKTQTLIGETAIYIMPGYSFRVVDALITNFHQPGSTLILLVAAFVGADWRNIYNEALANHYRFLSYGDCSLLFRKIT
ncbi:MAG: S-adenosylmethionine:tRNA ribosyltransferase-isomerase [Cytophagales bacterium]|jgi:S-adenosylmethionine:tRNA ribosyltransferase-isomerase|nr:S-adenosylmethionine:tRNA ribosyltransferase-isomerase [Cytophagales bacterium]